MHNLNLVQLITLVIHGSATQDLGHGCASKRWDGTAAARSHLVLFEPVVLVCVSVYLWRLALVLMD